MSAIQSLIKSARVIVFSKTYCPYCTKVKGLFDELGVEYRAVELDEGAIEVEGKQYPGDELQGSIAKTYNHRTVPAVFVNGTFVGGCDDTFAARKSGKLAELLK